MPKATQKSTVGNEEGDDPHGFINLVEAKAHTDSLDQVMTLIERQIKENDMADLLERAMSDMKATLANMIPTMQLADTSAVTRAIRDKCFNILLPRSDEMDQVLEEIIPSKEIPSASEVLRSAQRVKTLTEANQRVIAELFETLETAHDQLAMACSLLGRLSRTLNPEQLMIIIKASIRPLIQLNAMARLDTTTTASKPLELPEEQTEHVKLMLKPHPEASLLKKERINSATRLLAAMYVFKILNKFSNGTTQRRMQEEYQVRLKQLSLCLTGRKYLGGTNRKAIARKCKASKDAPEQSTSAE